MLRLTRTAGVEGDEIRLDAVDEGRNAVRYYDRLGGELLQLACPHTSLTSSVKTHR